MNRTGNTAPDMLFSRHVIPGHQYGETEKSAMVARLETLRKELGRDATFSDFIESMISQFGIEATEQRFDNYEALYEQATGEKPADVYDDFFSDVALINRGADLGMMDTEDPNRRLGQPSEDSLFSEEALLDREIDLSMLDTESSRRMGRKAKAPSSREAIVNRGVYLDMLDTDDPDMTLGQPSRKAKSPLSNKKREKEKGVSTWLYIIGAIGFGSVFFGPEVSEFGDYLLIGAICFILLRSFRIMSKM